MIGDIIQVILLSIVLIAYFVRIEIRLAKICENLKWIKREITLCRPP
jgi:hypothetical protein